LGFINIPTETKQMEDLTPEQLRMIEENRKKA
jgi:hypothetical protein